MVESQILNVKLVFDTERDTDVHGGLIVYTDDDRRLNDDYHDYVNIDAQERWNDHALHVVGIDDHRVDNYGSWTYDYQNDCPLESFELIFAKVTVCECHLLIPSVVHFQKMLSCLLSLTPIEKCTKSRNKIKSFMVSF